MSGEVEVGSFLEDRRDLAEAVAREGPRAGQAGNAGQGRLQRICDLTLDLLWRQGGGDRGDLHLSVGDVGDRIDRQLGQFEQTQRRNEADGNNDEPAEPNRRFDDSFEQDRRP